MPNPQLLLLDEPTAGVDPKARREFWNEIHALAGDGLTVLVSTHYMDEAERCHEIAYISNGVLLAHGTVPGVIAGSNLVTYGERGERRKPGEVCGRARDATRHRHGCAVWHKPARLGSRRGGAGGGDRARSRPAGPDLHAFGASLEDVFIDLMRQGKGRSPMTGPVVRAPPAGRRGGFLRRTWAMLIKEFIQLARDRVSFAMIIMVPLVQLLLFGYAINNNPRHLPTAVLLQEQSDVGRSILKALENTAYFKVDHVIRTEAEFDHLLASGQVLFAIEIPANFERSVRRGDRPALLVAADATDPVAAGSAMAALGNLVQTALRHDRLIPRLRLRRSRFAHTRGTTRQPTPRSTSCPGLSAPS